MHDHSADRPQRQGETDRRALLRAATAVGLSVPLSCVAWAVSPAVAAEMARAAVAWLSSLTDSQRREAQLHWSSNARERWHYVPRSRPGVTLRAMDDRQTAAAWNVLGSLLSTRGLDQVRGQLRIEEILGELTGNRSFRDPGNYALVVFGDPAGTAAWAWRFEGHHLSINVLVAPEHGVAVTPTFFGANPASVPKGHAHGGFRLLGAEEDAVFSLMQSIEGRQREEAIISNRSLGDIVAGPGRELSLQSKEGIALASLTEAQRGGVARILELYAETMRPEIANAAMARVREAGLEQIHFAWAGSLTRGQPHYFRIHGPTALIEYDNTQNGANHVHSVWIDPLGVFGRDMLRAHYQGQH